MTKQLWPIKYRPTTIDNYIFQDDAMKAQIEKFVAEKNIPHLMLSGHRGTGKTSLVHVLKHHLEIEDVDFLAIDASNENSVETIRSKIMGFISTHAISQFKLVLLNEADYLSINSQAILRTILEDEDIYNNARFILTYNYGNKIIPELKSRCQELFFRTLNRDKVLEHTAIILKKEKVKVASIELLEKYIDLSFPDLRKILQTLQDNVLDGRLQEPSSTTTDSSVEYKVQIIELLEKGDWQGIREVVNKNVDGDEFIELYKFFYEYLGEVAKFKDINKRKAGIVIIADHLYRNSLVADQEINFIAFIIRLLEV